MVLLLLSLSLSVKEIGDAEFGVIRRRRLAFGSTDGSWKTVSLIGDDLFNNSILLLLLSSSPFVVSLKSFFSSPFVLSFLANTKEFHLENDIKRKVLQEDSSPSGTRL